MPISKIFDFRFGFCQTKFMQPILVTASAKIKRDANGDVAVI